MGQQAAGQTREGIGHAQAYDGGKGGIDRGGADHVGIVAGGADSQTQAGMQKQGQKNDHGQFTAMAATSSLYCSARKVSCSRARALVNTVSVLFIFSREEPPMTAILME